MQQDRSGGFAMLVVSTRSRESVVVSGADGIHRLLKVTVLGIYGTNVKLGFEVDSDVPVHCSEVRTRIHAGVQAGSRTERSTVPFT
jgi:sRNA-binding carbon storage regulator CsrA